MIDTHAHLDACDEPAAALVARAREAGVDRIVTVGSGIDSCRAALVVADDEDGVFAALGIHPHQAGGEEAARLDRAGVPREERRALSKGQITLELLDRVRAEGWAGRVVVADAGYGVSGPWRQALEARGLHYVVGVTDQLVVFAQEPGWEWPEAAQPRDPHRPCSRPRLTEDSSPPLSLAALAARTPFAPGDLA